MARINIDETDFSNEKIIELTNILYAEFGKHARSLAIGIYVNALKIGQYYWSSKSNPKSLIPKEEFERDVDRILLYKVGLAHLVGDFVMIDDSENKFNWILQKRDSAKIGGKNKAKNKTHSSLAQLEFAKVCYQLPQLKQLLPSSSSSSSSSNYINNNNNMNNQKQEKIKVLANAFKTTLDELAKNNGRYRVLESKNEFEAKFGANTWDFASPFYKELLNTENPDKVLSNFFFKAKDYLSECLNSENKINLDYCDQS